MILRQAQDERTLVFDSGFNTPLMLSLSKHGFQHEVAEK